MEITVTHKIEAPELCSALREIAAALRTTGGNVQPAPAQADKPKRASSKPDAATVEKLDGAVADTVNTAIAEEKAAAEETNKPEPAKDNKKLYAEVFDLAKIVLKSDRTAFVEKLKELGAAGLGALENDAVKLPIMYEWLKSKTA